MVDFRFNINFKYLRGVNLAMNFKMRNTNRYLVFLWKLFIVFLLLWNLISCQKDQPSNLKPNSPLVFSDPDSTIIAMDVSSLAMILRKGVDFRNHEGKIVDIFEYLRQSGINTIRLRTWVGSDPNNNSDTIYKIAQLARKSKLLVWLDLHYSNTWADPGNQKIPQEWNSQDFDLLRNDLSDYTREMLNKFQPDFIQLGNEIDGGMLWPVAVISDTAKFYGLCREAVKQTRITSPKTRIIYHISSYKNADWFFNQLNNHGVDYDIGGVSYYPKWHGYNLDSLYQTLNRVQKTTKKRMIIAENSYPFTFSWADWTDNVVGWEGDLHPNYPGTTDGQSNFVSEMLKRTHSLPFASGYCYWEGVWIAFDGPESKQGSPWENQACFDFSFKALPVMKVFGE